MHTTFRVINRLTLSLAKCQSVYLYGLINLNMIGKISYLLYQIIYGYSSVQGIIIKYHIIAIIHSSSISPSSSKLQFS